MHNFRRHSMPDIHPETAYLKAFTIIHPLYFGDSIAICPKCDATGSDVSWSGWTSTGHCEVHGLDREETALGYQLRCQRCSKAASDQKTSIRNGEGTYCFSTTNHTFWERREHWTIPGESYARSTPLARSTHLHDPAQDGIPHFMKRCALTRQLFNVVIEFRLLMTSAGLAENIRRECDLTALLLPPELEVRHNQNSIYIGTTRKGLLTLRLSSGSSRRARRAWCRSSRRRFAHSQGPTMLVDMQTRQSPTI